MLLNPTAFLRVAPESMIQSAIVKPPSGECRNSQTEWRVGDGGADLGERPFLTGSFYSGVCTSRTRRKCPPRKARIKLKLIKPRRTTVQAKVRGRSYRATPVSFNGLSSTTGDNRCFVASVAAGYVLLDFVSNLRKLAVANLPSTGIVDDAIGPR